MCAAEYMQGSDLAVIDKGQKLEYEGSKTTIDR